MSDGNALARSSFNRYRDGIADMFGIEVLEPQELREKMRGLAMDIVKRYGPLPSSPS